MVNPLRATLVVAQVCPIRVHGRAPHASSYLFSFFCAGLAKNGTQTDIGSDDQPVGDLIRVNRSTPHGVLSCERVQTASQT